MIGKVCPCLQRDGGCDYSYCATTEIASASSILWASQWVALDEPLPGGGHTRASKAGSRKTRPLWDSPTIARWFRLGRALSLAAAAAAAARAMPAGPAAATSCLWPSPCRRRRGRGVILGTAEGRILCVPVVQAHCEVDERQLQVYLTCIKMLLPSPSCSLCSRGQTHAHNNMTMVDRCGELGSSSQLDTMHNCHTHTHMHTPCCESQEWAFSQAVAKRWRMQPGGSESDETGPVDSIVSPRRPCEASHLALEDGVGVLVEFAG